MPGAQTPLEPGQGESWRQRGEEMKKEMREPEKKKDCRGAIGTEPKCFSLCSSK